MDSNIYPFQSPSQPKQPPRLPETFASHYGRPNPFQSPSQPNQPSRLPETFPSHYGRPNPFQSPSQPNQPSRLPETFPSHYGRPNPFQSIPQRRLVFGNLAPQQEQPQAFYHPQQQMGQTSSNPVRLGIDLNQDQQQQVQKRRRGRPRKHNGTSPLISPSSSSYSGGGYGDVGNSSGNFSDPTANRKRGRPPASPNKQLNALGAKLTVHAIQVNPGEDICPKVMALSDQGPITICILSANGSLSKVNLRQGYPRRYVTYEGDLEIVNLNGWFSNDDVNGISIRNGSLSVAFTGHGAGTIGGVANSLVAASQVQIVVGSFVHSDGGDQNPEPTNMLQSASVSQGTGNESSEVDKNGKAVSFSEWL